MLYECHITVSVFDSEIATKIANNLHWKTSKIAGDPVLGDGTYFYLTSHSDDYVDMWNRLKNTTTSFTDNGVRVIREKIELIMYDTKVRI